MTKAYWKDMEVINNRVTALEEKFDEMLSIVKDILDLLMKENKK